MNSFCATILLDRTSLIKHFQRFEAKNTLLMFDNYLKKYKDAKVQRNEHTTRPFIRIVEE